MEELKSDAYSPAEIASRISQIAAKKSGLDFFRLFLLAILAGIYIGFGGEFFTMVTHKSGLAYGMNSLVGGLVFSLGLILVVIAGAELFTGNTLMVMGFADGVIGASALLRSWAIAFAGNIVGALALVGVMYLSRQWSLDGNLVGARALLIANAKVNLGFVDAFARGILCNALVVLAVWLCFGARSTTDKILAIIFPITAFVASGFEHSIANGYFIPMGIMLKGQPAVIAAAEVMNGAPVSLANLTWAGFLLKNLLPVTLGNIVGGSLLVGLVYWSIYLREFSFRSLMRVGQVGFRLLFFTNPRDLSPVKIWHNLSGFYSFLSLQSQRHRPVPTDLTTLVPGETGNAEKDRHE
jgi:formate transporter